MATSSRSPVVTGVSPAFGEVAHLGHVELRTPDLDASVECFRDVLGMRIVDEVPGGAHLRGESEYERIGLTLTASRQPGIGHLGLRVRSADALTRRVAALRESGAGGDWVEANAGHGTASRFDAGAGHAVELYWETERLEPAAAQRPIGSDRLTRRGGPGVGVRRLDHVNLLAADVRAATTVAWRDLGATLLDEVHDDAGEPAAAFTTFGQRPLELVYTRDPRGARGRLHHVAFWVDTREEVLRAADIFVDHGVTIEVAPAQHTIGRSFFLYGFEPGGNRIEVTTGADLVLDPDPPTRVWTAEQRRRGIGWGTTFPPSWTSYGTPDVSSPPRVRALRRRSGRGQPTSP